jgi:hypothetical protein
MLLPHSFSTKSLCLALSVTLAVIGYIPFINRLRRRHHSRDLSKTFQWCNLLVQMNNGVLAISEHAPFLVVWYVVQTMFASVVLWLVYRYWDRPNPQ